MVKLGKNLLGPLSFFALVLAALLGLSWGRLTGTIAVGSDLAADMLLANKLRDEGWLLVGIYSRFHFNHPGPFWFYFNHAIELLLGWTELSRYQLWMIGSVLINSACVSFAGFALSKYLVGRMSIRLSATFLCILIGLVGGDVVSLWMPDRLIAPYIAFFVCLLHLSEGNHRYLWASVSLACMLIHGYASMPVFTLPFLAASMAIGFLMRRANVNWKAIRKQAYYSLGIAALFAFPICYDLLVSDQSNLSKILAARARFATMPKPDWQEMRDFVQTLVFQENAIKYAIGLPLIALLVIVARTRESLKSRIVFLSITCLVVTLTMLAFYKQTPSTLYYFVAQFYVGIPVTLLTAMLSPFAAGTKEDVFPGLKPGGAIFLQIVSFAAIAVCFLFPLKNMEERHNVWRKPILRFADLIEQGRPFPSFAGIDYSEHNLWPLVSGLLVELDRRHVGACTTWKHMAFLYTDKGVCHGKGLPAFRVTRAAECHNRCLIEIDGYGLSAYRFNPITLGAVLSYDAEDLFFEQWHSPEKGFRWSSGNSSSIHFRISGKVGILHRPNLTMKFYTLGSQTIHIYLNGTKVHSIATSAADGTMSPVFTETTPLDPSLLLADDINVLRFDLPQARAPNATDGRILALALRSLSFH